MCDCLINLSSLHILLIVSFYSHLYFDSPTFLQVSHKIFDSSMNPPTILDIDFQLKNAFHISIHFLFTFCVKLLIGSS